VSNPTTYRLSNREPWRESGPRDVSGSAKLRNYSPPKSEQFISRDVSHLSVSVVDALATVGPQTVGNQEQQAIVVSQFF
jgi:hypothetical protein